MVGGAAYYAGKKVQSGREAEADQDARIDDLESQQYAAAPAPSGGISPETIEQLKQLGELKTSGILTDAEFEEQKRKLLAGS
jgi:hypothetical protein